MNKQLDIDDYWKISISKNGKLCDIIQVKDTDTDKLQEIAFSAKEKGYDVEVEKCNRIVDFITDFYQFIKDTKGYFEGYF